MRIISGKHKGRRIELGKDATGIRPTSDFAREAVFNILTHGDYAREGHSFIDKAVLDVYCGTGAFGFEALSRGAASATFIDQSREAINSVRQNAERFHETEAVDVLLADARRLPRARKPYALIFIDPPYGKNMALPTLDSLAEGGWIGPDGLVVVEHDAKETLDELSAQFIAVDERRYGRAVMTLIKMRL